MTRNPFRIATFLCASRLAGCTSIRVSGQVTDQVTGDLLPGCGVTFGSFYSSCDGAGHYVIKGRSYWKTMHVVAPGYVAQNVVVDASKTRTPVINVPMERNPSLERWRKEPAAQK